MRHDEGGAWEVEGLVADGSPEYAYLKVPPAGELRACVGLVLAGMATRARVGVGGLEEAVEVLEGVVSDDAPTRLRFSIRDEGVVAEVEEPAVGGDAEGAEEGRWRTVVELIS